MASGAARHCAAAFDAIAMNTTGTSPRRLIGIVSFIVAIVFGAWCVLWHTVRSPLNPEDVYPFLGVAFVHSAAAAAFIVSAKTRWRWAMLLLVIPCAMFFIDWGYELWRMTHM